MKVYLLKYWERLNSSFWFLPVLMAAGAVAAAFGTLALDAAAAERGVRFGAWLYQGHAEGARVILGAVAGSMINIAGVVFSMTLVALSLTSSQFGPRLLRNFMRDTVNQVVLGTFIATFLYCLLVLRTIGRSGGEASVPHLSVTLGVFFSLVSLLMLIYFIHHVSVSIQANEIAARIGADVIAGIERMFPADVGQEQADNAPGADEVPASFEEESEAVLADEDGYIQFIESEALLELAAREDLLVRLEERPGHYVVAGTCIARVWPPARVTDRVTSQVRTAIVTGNQRTHAHDLEQGINELVEVAVRALSIGINDPFTAMTCVDRLGSALARLAQQPAPSPWRRDTHHQLRIIVPPVTFPVILDAALNQIRQSARNSAAVSIRMLEMITVVAGFAHLDEDIAALDHHATLIARGASAALPEAEDRCTIEARLADAKRALEQIRGRQEQPRDGDSAR